MDNITHDVFLALYKEFVEKPETPRYAVGLQANQIVLFGEEGTWAIQIIRSTVGPAYQGPG